MRSSRSNQRTSHGKRIHSESPVYGGYSSRESSIASSSRSPVRDIKVMKRSRTGRKVVEGSLLKPKDPKNFDRNNLGRLQHYERIYFKEFLEDQDKTIYDLINKILEKNLGLRDNSYLDEITIAKSNQGGNLTEMKFPGANLKEELFDEDHLSRKGKLLIILPKFLGLPPVQENVSTDSVKNEKEVEIMAQDVNELLTQECLLPARRTLRAIYDGSKDENVRNLAQNLFQAIPEMVADASVDWRKLMRKIATSIICLQEEDDVMEQTSTLENCFGMLQDPKSKTISTTPESHITMETIGDSITTKDIDMNRQGGTTPKKEPSRSLDNREGVGPSHSQPMDLPEDVLDGQSTQWDQVSAESTKELKTWTDRETPVEDYGDDSGRRPLDPGPLSPYSTLSVNNLCISSPEPQFSTSTSYDLPEALSESSEYQPVSVMHKTEEQLAVEQITQPQMYPETPPRQERVSPSAFVCEVSGIDGQNVPSLANVVLIKGNPGGGQNDQVWAVAANYTICGQDLDDDKWTHNDLQKLFPDV